MQRNIERPFVRPSPLDRLTRVLHRARRYRAARRYAAHGWTVERQAETVLLVTGSELDALEVPASLGARRRADHSGPVAVTAAGRWIFLVRPGTPLCPELERRLDVVRHGPGSRVAVAPSRLPEGLVRWAVTPRETRWRLPAAEAVQRMLVDALGAADPPRPPVVPRQLSTSRRAA
jgi:hypothetical protein